MFKKKVFLTLIHRTCVITNCVERYNIILETSKDKVLNSHIFIIIEQYLYSLMSSLKQKNLIRLACASFEFSRIADFECSAKHCGTEQQKTVL